MNNQNVEVLEFVLTGEEVLEAPSFDLGWIDVNVYGDPNKKDIVIFKCGHKMYVGDIYISQYNQLDSTAKSNLPSILLILKCQCGCEIDRSSIEGTDRGTPFSLICWYELLITRQLELDFE